MIAPVSVIYVLTMLVHAGLFVTAVSRRAPAARRRLLAGASLASMLWAVAVLLAEPGTATGYLAIEILDALRIAAWSGLIVSMLGTLSPEGRARRGPLLAVVGVLALNLAGTLTVVSGYAIAGAIVYPKLIASVVGLALVENLLRNTPDEQKWFIKHLVIGCALIFAFDLIVYSDLLLFGRPSAALFEARALVSVVAVPLIVVTAVRNPSLGVRMHVSRDVVFYSVSFVLIGTYFIVISLLAFYFRDRLGGWGDVVAPVAVAAGAVLSALLLLSGAARSRLRGFINRNFFSYRYDYRKEWLRLIGTVATERHVAGLGPTVVKALADIVDSPAGGLWLRSDEDQAYGPAAAWHVRGKLTAVGADTALVRQLEERVDVVAFAPAGGRRGPAPGDAPDFPVPGFRAWIAVPLVHKERLIGFVALEPPRAPRSLNWEDHDLLKTAGQQLASYIAEDEAARVLLESRDLDRFNRRFAFVVHDIKNIVGQLSLLVQNTERFGDRPDFQRDLLVTVRNSTDRMKRLLEQLRAAQEEAAGPPVEVDLAPLVRAAVEQWRRAGRPVAFAGDGAAASLSLVRPDRLGSVLDHLIQNALDVTPEGGSVTVALQTNDTDIRIEVRDHGPGMDEEFVRTELFRPLRSTKGFGFGIGAYQTRETVREMGGRLEVDSRVGRGTTMTIIFSRSRQKADRAWA